MGGLAAGWAHFVTATEPERGLQSAAASDLEDGLGARQDRIESRGLLRTEVPAPAAVSGCARADWEPAACYGMMGSLYSSVPRKKLRR
jgi:hypothetical protein